jgi:hypothetical protein
MNPSNSTQNSRVAPEATKVLTRLCRGDSVRDVMFQNTIQESMHSRLWHEEQRIREINERLKELTKAYNEFLDLQKEAETRKRRMGVLFSLVGPIDYHAPEGQETEHKTAMSVLSERADELSAGLPVWKAMREYLQHAREARIGEMEAFFKEVNYADGNRQAMESALKRHPKIFKIRKEKREKYISLK